MYAQLWSRSTTQQLVLETDRQLDRDAALGQLLLNRREHAVECAPGQHAAKMTRAAPSSRRAPTRDVFTSTPITPETTTSAPSTTRSDATVSAWNPESQRVDQVDLRPCIEVHERRSVDISGAARPLQSETVVPASTVEPVGLSRLEQECLDERGLPRPVADDGDVADLPGFMASILSVNGTSL